MSCGAPVRCASFLPSVLSEAHTSRCEHGNRGNSHNRGSEPSEELGYLTVDVVAHEGRTARDPHNHYEEWRCRHSIYNCHENKQVNWIDVQQAQSRPPSVPNITRP